MSNKGALRASGTGYMVHMHGSVIACSLTVVEKIFAICSRQFPRAELAKFSPVAS